MIIKKYLVGIPSTLDSLDTDIATAAAITIFELALPTTTTTPTPNYIRMSYVRAYTSGLQA